MNEFDLVVWGATGFTGALVAEYLAREYAPGAQHSTQAPVRWALAGRNPTKLAELQKRLGVDVPLIQADSNDRESLDAMVKQTSVVLSTVGPYALYGNELVAACAQSGTHYCDLAGEVQWLRKIIDEHSEAAKASGALIVPCCGFDSIPSDLGTLFVHNAMRERFDTRCAYVKFRAGPSKGGFSGGTAASLMHMMKESQDNPALQAMLANPYSLDPPGGRGGCDGLDLTTGEFDEDFDSYIAPFVMAGINTRVVRRSNALLDYAYGEDFRYDEATLVGPGPSGFAKAFAMAAGSGMVLAAAAVPILRSLLERVIPEPGEGPSAELRESGFFNIEFFARGVDDSQAVIRARVTGDRDPGYGSTAKMLTESAIVLAQSDLPLAGGLWTPASALGVPLIERLQAHAGLTFELV